MVTAVVTLRVIFQNLPLNMAVLVEKQGSLAWAPSATASAALRDRPSVLMVGCHLLLPS